MPPRPLSAATRLILALLWLALLAVAGWTISQRLQMSGDLRKFMPAPVANSAKADPEAARAACAGDASMLFA